MEGKLQVRKSTWHHRLVSFMYVNPLWDRSSSLDGGHIKNLCAYGRRVIVALLLFVPFTVLVAPMMIAAHSFGIWPRTRMMRAKERNSLSFLALWVFYSAILIPWSEYLARSYQPQHAPVWVWAVILTGGLLEILGLFTLALAAFIGLILVVVWGMLRLSDTTLVESARDAVELAFQEDSALVMAWRWIQAKKAKICPAIEFVEG